MKSLCVLIVVCLCNLGDGQQLIIRNVKLVKSFGQAIDKVSVHIKDGKIAGIGDDLPLPDGDLKVIEAAGLWAYPGFVDAYGFAGVADLPKPPEEDNSRSAYPKPTDQGYQAARAAAALDRTNPGSKVMIAGRDAADGLDFASLSVEGLRKGGFCAQLTVPRGGLIAGLCSLVSLSPSSDGKAVRMIPGAGVKVSLLRGLKGYPTTTMGAISAIRQALYDAQDYLNRKNASPNGDFTSDPNLENIAKLLDGTPAFFVASTTRDVKYALQLQKEFGLKLVLVGVKKADEVIPLVKDRVAAVVLLSSFEEIDKYTTAGITALIGSGDNSSGKADKDAGMEVIADIREAAQDDARKAALLNAVTSAAGKLFGAESGLGSLEIGAPANITLASGDVFDAKTRITGMIVAGKLFEYPAESPKTEKKEGAGDD